MEGEVVNTNTNYVIYSKLNLTRFKCLSLVGNLVARSTS